MAKGTAKASSKRLTLSKQYKIKKKVKEHHRKLNKLSKKGIKNTRRSKKDPGIPNSWPFKEEMLKEIAEEKKHREELLERQRQQRIKANQLKKARSIQELAEDAREKEKGYEMAERERTALREDRELHGRREEVSHGDSTKRFYREFKKVVEGSDIILEVLDARDPLGCRSPEVERRILADGTKRLVLVLNKVDLVPRENAEAWLKRLRLEFPTIVFKANTQEQHSNLGQSGAKGGRKRGRGASAMPTWAPTDVLNSAEALGAGALLQLLKNYSRNDKIKTSLTVGVIGYPNVGKSSLINSLKRSKAAHVGAMPGVTKVIQEVALDSKIKIMDCPGIIFSCGDSDSDLILRNASKLSKLLDPTVPVQGILNRCDREKLMDIYKISAFSTVEEFLFKVAQRKGKVLRGGVPDVTLAGRLVLQDWNSGKIPFYTVPPKDAAGTHVASAIVAQWAKDFEVDKLKDTEVQILKDLEPASADLDFMQIECGNTVADDMFKDEAELESEDEEDEGWMDEDEEDGDEDGEEDGDEDGDEDGEDEEDDDDEDDESSSVKPATKRAKVVPLAHKVMGKQEAALNPMNNQAKKLAMKMDKKKAAKEARRSAGSGRVASADPSAYDFGALDE